VDVVEPKRDFDDDFDWDRLTILGCRCKFPLIYRCNRIVVQVRSGTAGYLQVTRQSVDANHKVDIDIALL